ncbi:MAG: ribonuclease R [Chitinophagaceae bacterium]|nr:ribonuclease R [Chitinophagaceae bacterium]
MKERKNNQRKSRTTAYGPAVSGKLDVSRQGMGYVTVPGMAIDIIVKKENLKNAMNGDTVEVSIIKLGKNTKRPEGIITKVLKRGQTELVGTVDMNLKFAFVIPDNKNFTKDIFISEKNAVGLKTGDRVIVKITEWNEHMKNPEGIITDHLTADRINEIAMKEILLSAGFNLEFPKEVMQELERIPNAITPEDIRDRWDMRDILTITIDPHDAKDFDDAISYQKLENGHHEIGVHIADVGHYILPDTALDKEAFHRATSVYLPDRVLPMLPEKISNELCSLRPHEDKLTFSVVFEMDDQAQVKNFRIAKTIIHSERRFTYEEVQAIIEGGEGDHRDVIMTLHLLTQTIRKRKFEAGAINFLSEEARFLLDEHGVPYAVQIKTSEESHQLIEELMLLANKTVAEYVSKVRLKGKQIPFPYRIHDTPDIDKLKTFAEFASRFGHTFDLRSPEAIAKSFNKMIAHTGQHPEDEILHTLGIRTMSKAVYSPDNIGHYGLAFEFYCHFTSPIRRYPDVLVHRVLLECLKEDIHPLKRMKEMCDHCSERERKAMEAEREGGKYKQVEFMQKFIGEEFDAVVTGVSNFGFWAATVEHRCEGLIQLQNMSSRDEFIYDERQFALIGKRSKTKYQIGKAIRVRVAAANLEKRQIDFELIEG